MPTRRARCTSLAAVACLLLVLGLLAVPGSASAAGCAGTLLTQTFDFRAPGVNAASGNMPFIPSGDPFVRLFSSGDEKAASGESTGVQRVRGFPLLEFELETGSSVSITGLSVATSAGTRQGAPGEDARGWGYEAPAGVWIVTATFTGCAVGAPPIVGHAAPVSHLDAYAQGCADVMLVGVRGSGQTNAWGAEVAVVANEVNRLLPRSVSLRQVWIEYSAASVQSIATDGYGQYFGSIGHGQSELTQLLTHSAMRCPNEKWILAGYSQGALVVNLASRGWAGDPHLAALALIADPNRFPNGSGVNAGTSGSDKGIYAAGMQGATSLPPALSSRTASLCNNLDIVCDTTDKVYAAMLPALLLGRSLGAKATTGVVKHGVDVHTTYTRTSHSRLLGLASTSASRARAALGR
jgi:Cutinase